MSHQKTFVPLHRRLARWRRVAPIFIVALAGLHQLVLRTVQSEISPLYHDWLAIALYGLSGGVVIWLALGWLVNRVARHEQTEAELRRAYDNLTETHRQLLAVHDIGCEIASASDMQQVLELAARAPTHLAGAMGSTIVTFDEAQKRLKLDMAWGLSDDYLNGLRRQMEAGIPHTQCRNCNPLTARVGNDCPLFNGLEPLAHREGIQSLICLPIVRDQKREGILNAYFPSPNGPPEEQVRLLNIVATEIASALDGARLRATQMATLYALENLTETRQELDDLLAQLLNTTLAGWNVSRGAILLYDPPNNAWHHWTQQGLGNNPSHPHFDLALHLAEQVRHSKQVVLISNLARHPAWQPVNGKTPPHSVAAAPLIAGSEFLGVLVMVAPKPDFFRPEQSVLFSTIAHQAALAISNAQLHARVQQLAILEERYRLSREMHDGLAQTLGSLGWQLDHLQTLLAKKELDQLAGQLAIGRRMVREAYMDVREAIDGLRLQSEYTGGLAGALKQYLADFEERTGIKTTLEMSANPPHLAAEPELQLLRIVQEALTNVRKHARARQVWVRLNHQPGEDRLTLTIADDGCGFDMALPRGRGHLGLSTMRERAESQNGSLAVVTGPNQGTRISVTLPLAQS